MPVTSETNRVSYSGDDSTVDFTVPFYFLLDASIEVTLVDSDDAETTWVLDTDYTVTDAGVFTGGEITATTAPATGETLVIIRSEALTQTTDYIENDDFPAASHERALDKAMMINQQQQEEIARCITAPVGDDGTTDYTLPIYSASKFLQWHPTSKMLRNAGLTTTGTATIGTDVGDLVELVEVSSGVAGFPALALDNMTYSGSTIGDSVAYDTGTASGAIPLNSDLGTASLVDTGTGASDTPLNSNLGTASFVDTGTDASDVPLNSDLGTASLADTGTGASNVPLNSNSSIVKAWISFDGTGTISINDSFNVTSITDDGVGLYTVTWDTNFANTNYCVVATADPAVFTGVTAVAVGSVQIRVYTHSGTLSDSAIVNVMAIGAQ